MLTEGNTNQEKLFPIYLRRSLFTLTQHNKGQYFNYPDFRSHKN